MVFFTCNNCGESVKKPSVEKHLTQCRKPVFISCMDCLKDFREDYVGHTRCITEAEKYSDKNYVPKESQNKGQKKQDSWLEIVRSILNSNELDVSPAVRGIFQKLQSYDNVPRKKVKFENFVSNSMRCRKDQAEAVWNVLEKALENFKAAAAAARGVDNKNQQANGATIGGGDDNQNPLNGNNPNENKKDNKNDKSIENGVHGKEEEVTSSMKKKKKNKTKIEEEQNIEMNANKGDKNEETNDNLIKNGIDDEETEIVNISKKKKKKNKKRNVENDNTENNINEEPVKKKKKESVEDSTLSTNEELTIIEAQSSMDDSSKKKRKLQTSKNDDDDVINENGSAGKVSKVDQNAEPVTNGKPPKPKVNEFQWNEVIFKILGKHDNEIPVEKLKKKVLKKYQVRCELDEIPRKVEKTFNKHLRKSGLLVENDVVKTT